MMQCWRGSSRAIRLAQLGSKAHTLGQRPAVRRRMQMSDRLVRCKGSATPSVAPKPFVTEYFVPFVRSVATIGVSMGLGDAACQMIESGGETGLVNIDRVRKMMFIGAFISGPVSHSWMLVVERLIPGSSTRAAVAKTVVSSLYAFFISIPLTFSAVTLIPSGRVGETQKGMDDAVAKIKRDLLPTFAAGALYWPVWNIIIFKTVPVNYRAIAGSLVGVVWNIYLSSVANKTQPTLSGDASQKGATALLEPQMFQKS